MAYNDPRPKETIMTNFKHVMLSSLFLADVAMLMHNLQQFAQIIQNV